MAKRPVADDGMLPSPTFLRDFGSVNMDCSSDGVEEVSLEEILNLYSQPINEEQAWAVCYQCCRTLAQRHRRRCSKAAATAVSGVRRIQGPGDVMIGRDGAVELHFEESTGKKTNLVFSGCQATESNLLMWRVHVDKQSVTKRFSLLALIGQTQWSILAKRPCCCGCLLPTMCRICLRTSRCTCQCGEYFRSGFYSPLMPKLT